LLEESQLQQNEPQAPLQSVGLAIASQWNLATRIAFRFVFVFLGLYILIFPAGVFIPFTDFLPSGINRLWNAVVPWVGSHILHIGYPILLDETGSGDRTCDWVQAFCILAIAIASTLVWSVLDRKRENYVTLHKWFRLIARLSLATTMFVYGIDKIVPLQMPYPGLARLLEPFGNFSPMGVLWYSIGASRGYEIFAGCAEMIGGIFLIFPRTTTFGALVSLFDMFEVFMLNMWYDVPVKLFAFISILLALTLLAPETPRLANIFFLNRPAGSSTQPQLFRRRIANRIALALQIAIGIYLVSTNFYNSAQGWKTFGGGRPKSPLYGIWNVDEMSIDGQVHPPLLTDDSRWRRMLFDSPTGASFQRKDDTFQGYAAEIKMDAKSLVLKKSNDKNWMANFSFQRPAPESLILDGDMDGHKIHMQLKLFDRAKFLLVNRGFHWINERPFNR
jgi:uncharacterized membrane protein YphA (DoxX/SURF4 family)